MTRAAATLLVLLMTVALAGPASAYYDDEREIDFVESTVYFTPGTTGVGNVDGPAGERHGWSEDEPAAATEALTVATAHSGFLTLVDEEAGDSQAFRATGTQVGHLDTIAVDLYYRGANPLDCGMDLAVEMTLDGALVLNMDGITGRVPVSTRQVDDDYTVATLVLTNIHEMMERFNLAGDVDTTREIGLTFHQYPLCQEAVWSVGTAAAPSGLQFNVHSDDLRRHTVIDVLNPPVPDAAE